MLFIIIGSLLFQDISMRIGLVWKDVVHEVLNHIDKCFIYLSNSVALFDEKVFVPLVSC